MSLFITFEGGEGSGKSTQIASLFKKLNVINSGSVTLTREPGGTSLGEYLRNTLKWTDAFISPETELLLFNASRAQLINEIIKPELTNGKIVVCDRYTDSTIAYQGYGRGLDVEIVKSVNNTATQGLKPNLTILLDITPEQGFSRIQERLKDRFEKEDMSFHQRVREGYLRLAADEPQRWLVINAGLSKERIKQVIWKKVSSLLTA
jgi:dTMP kinase